MEKITVIIADDVVQTQENIRDLLCFAEDIEVVATAGDGQEAVALAKTLCPDIILMDINMPVQDGIAAAMTLGTMGLSHVAVVLMSVNLKWEYRLKAMTVGVQYFLEKPFSSDELIGTLREVYDRRLPPLEV